MTDHRPADRWTEDDTRPLWHLAEEEHWQEALRTGSYTRSTRGRTLAQEGFIHCSYPDQLPGVAKAHYQGVTEPLVVLEIDPTWLAKALIEVRLEPAHPEEPDSPHFPHVYGELPVHAVTRTRPATVEKGWLDLGPWRDQVG